MNLLYPILFWFFAAVAIGSAVVAVVRRDLVANAMALVAMVLSLAGLFLLLDSPFLAMVQVVVYAGAVMVLFVFVVMLMGYRAVPLPRKFGAVIGAHLLIIAFTIEAILMLHRPIDLPFMPHAGSNARGVVRLLFQDYLLPFELTALIILVAVVGVLVISDRRHRT